MEFLIQIFDTIYENFFDPRKRVFVGYLFSAIVIAFLWLCVVKKKTLKECFYKIFDKKIFFSKSAKANKIFFLSNIIILMFFSPILITQLTIASVIFESLLFQTYLLSINTESLFETPKIIECCTLGLFIHAIIKLLKSS